MIACRILILSLMFLLALTVTEGYSKEAPEIYQENKDSIVFIKVSVAEPTGKITTTTGTGVIISRRGHVLTASHLLSTRLGATIVIGIGSNAGQLIPAQQLQMPACCDLALLKLPDSQGPYRPAKLGNHVTVHVGQPVVALGFPLGNDYALVGGLVSGMSGNENDMWQVQNPLTYGYSGGPMFDADGGIIGIVKGGVPDAQGMSYIVPLNYAAPLIISADVPWPPAPISPPREPPSPISATPPAIAAPAVLHGADIKRALRTGRSMRGEVLSCSQGPSCVLLHVSIPANAEILSIRRSFKEATSGSWSDAANCSNAIGWCEWDDAAATVGVNGTSKTISTVLKNWSDGRDRDARLEVDYTVPPDLGAAVREHSLQQTRAALAAGADPDSMLNASMPILWWAVDNQLTEIALDLISRSGAPDATNIVADPAAGLSVTPLYQTAVICNQPLFDALVARGANLQFRVRNSRFEGGRFDGWTVMDAATEARCAPIIGRLTGAGVGSGRRSSAEPPRQAPDLRPSGSTLADAANAWVKAASDARGHGSVSPDAPLPVDLVRSRTVFEDSWLDAGLGERKRIGSAVLYNALSSASGTHRLEENDSAKKTNSLSWADQTVAYFDQIQDRHFLTEALLDKAAIYLELSQLEHTNGVEFQRIARQGDQVMARAYSLADAQQKPGALRLWSRFYYNLARPASNRLSEKWDNNYLGLAFSKISEASEIDKTMRTATQLGRTAERYAANPPQDGDAEWTKTLRTIQEKLVATWNAKKATLSAPIERIPALNIIGVLTNDIVLREWRDAIDADRPAAARKGVAELRNVALPAQREAFALVFNTELAKQYGFDLRYDLARINAVICQLEADIDPPRSEADFEEALDNMKQAKAAATAVQLGSALDSIEGYPSFAGLSSERRSRLRAVLTP